MAAELGSKWLCFPLSRQLRGFKFPIFGYSSASDSPVVISYGVAAAVLCAACVVGFWLGKNRVLSWSGTFLIWLGALAILQVSYLDAPLLRVLASEFDQQQAAQAFSHAALPVNAGGEPTVLPRLPLDTVGERLAAGWYFARFGTWFAMLIGVTALGCGVRGEQRRTMIWVAVGGLSLLVVGCLERPTIAELLCARARAAEAMGAPDGAINMYRRALEIDAWLSLNLDVYERIGAIDSNLGRRTTVEYALHHAERSQVDPSKSAAELIALIPRTRGPFAVALRTRVADLLSRHGRSLHAYGAYGAAISEFQAAQIYDPEALLPGYYLSRAYYLIGDYRQTIALSERLVLHAGDPVFRANLLSNIGDAYTKLGAFEDAKIAYRKSYSLDYSLNLRALSALNGP